MEFELKTVDSEPYTVTKTKKTGTTYVQRGYPATASGKRRERPLDNQEVVADENWNIYMGAYIPDCDYLVKWGLKDNMIRPQDPKEIGNAEFSYSFYMYQPYEMRNLAIPEKIEAAVDGMIHALLKVQQDIATAVPPGWAIDETALQNIDFGLGDDGNKAIDHARLYWQTGKLWYKGIDAEGNRIPAPISEMPNVGFAPHIEAFIRTYQFWYQTLKDELGEDPNLISSALQPRVTAGNVEASQVQAEYATDYMYRAYSEVVKMTARKISCLLKDSVTYGAQAYRNIVNAEDIGDRVFSTEIRFLPTGQDVMRFEAMMNQVIAATPDLLSFIDPFQLTRVAQEDVKLAEMLFRQGQKKLLLFQRQSAIENQQQTIDGQIKAAQAAEQAKGKNLEMELDMKNRGAEIQSKAKEKEIVLQMVSELVKIQAQPTAIGKEQKLQEGKVSPQVQQLMELAIKNIAIPIAMENEAMISAIMQPQEEIPQEQMQQPINEPQPQMVA